VGRAANGAGAGAGAGAAGAGAGASAAAAAANGAPPAAPVALKKVVLSDFSRGRRLMLNVRANAPGLSSYLNEIWDFDGNDGALPTPTRDVRVIHYNQAHARGTWDNFHVPATRWEGFHGKELANRADANVHSNIPDMLGWHAAAVSGVGKMYGHETF
jgi:hypothetical protein